MRRALAGAVTFAALLFAGTAKASPEDVFGFGIRSSAMGATGAADARGYEAVYGNPSLLPADARLTVTFGAVGAVFDMRADGKRLPYEPLRGSVIGAVVPIPFGGLLKNRIAVGLGFFTPFNLVVRGRILYPEKQQFPLPDRTQSVAVQAGIGVDLGYGLRIGGGFAALAALSGSVLVATDTTGRIGTVVEDTLLASYGPIVGASFEFLKAYRVGLTFRGPLVGRFNVVITVRDLGDITVPPLNISGIAQYDPWQIALEFARVKGPVRASIGATYKHWSAYPGAAEATVRCPVPVPIPGQEPPICDVLSPPPPGYSNTVVARAGVEALFAPGASVTMALRGGFFFEPSPAPQQTKESNQFDNARAALTVGYGLSLGRPLPKIDLDMFGQVQALLPREHVKDVGVLTVVPQRSTSGGLIAAFGASAGVSF